MDCLYNIVCYSKNCNNKHSISFQNRKKIRKLCYKLSKKNSFDNNNLMCPDKLHCLTLHCSFNHPFGLNFMDRVNIKNHLDTMIFKENIELNHGKRKTLHHQSNIRKKIKLI